MVTLRNSAAQRTVDSGAVRSAQDNTEQNSRGNSHNTSSAATVAIVDTGSGDYSRLQAVLEECGVASFLTSHRLEMLHAAALILPDGPTFTDYSRFFALKRVAQIVELRISGGLPVLACGTAMHVLCDGAEIKGSFHASPAPQWDGTVVELPSSSSLPPAQLHVPLSSALLEGLDGMPCEVHPRYALCTDPTDGMDEGPLTPPRLAWVRPPTPYVAAIDNGALCASAWAPESSGEAGLRLLRNWLRLANISSVKPVEGQQ